MNLVARVQAILLKPKEEWVKIKDEPTTIQQLFVPYAVILAAIPAVAQFLGWAVIGGFRIPFAGGSWMTRALPSLCALSILGSLYGLYLLYLGFATPLMGTPKEKITGYFVVSLVVAIVLMFVVGIILGAAFAVRGVVAFF